MRGNRSTDTRPELAIRSSLHRLGFRFRKDYLIREGPPRGIRADMVFTKQRVAIFVDGCFWHGCPQHGRVPKANADYWHAKLSRNVERDKRNTEALARAGWKVIRVWEHQDVDQAVEEIAGQIKPLSA